jgi:hypothetical protein
MTALIGGITRPTRPYRRDEPAVLINNTQINQEVTAKMTVLAHYVDLLMLRTEE